jgi:hypothetical protein
MRRLITLAAYAELYPEWTEHMLHKRSAEPGFPKPHPLRKRPKMYWLDELECWFGYVREAA